MPYFNLIALADLQCMYTKCNNTIIDYASAIKTEIKAHCQLNETAYLEKRLNYLEHYLKKGYFPYMPNKDIEEKMRKNIKTELEIISQTLA